ncbi:MAG: polysaccharide deacetylase family protein [Anaerolineales bacterium]|nr:polysaccharide deacetylase family protein [Anaerolineales bacterium]
MNALRIALDPDLTLAYGPEIHWTWRTILSTLGWAWIETPLSEPCDLAYTPDPGRAPLARLCVQADPLAWERRAELRLKGLMNGRHELSLTYNGWKPPPPALLANAAQTICRRDLALEMFWLMTGQEERYWPQDRHGFRDYTGSIWQEQRVFDKAPASALMAWLKRTLLELGCPPPLPPWPHGKRAAAAAGHDVDYPEVIRWLEPLRVLARQRACGLGPAWEVAVGKRHHWHFRGWMDLEQSLGVRSAFYFLTVRGSLVHYALGRPDAFYDVGAAPFRAVLRELAEEGFEVGLQASYLAYTRPEKLSAEKRRLEDLLGRSVVGNHHHYWHTNPADVEETLLFHEQAGFVYDSSLNHDRYLGWRRGCATPFFPFHSKLRREIRTLQVPLGWMDDQLFRLAANNPGDPRERLQALIDRAAAVEGCFVMDVHEYVFDEVLYPGWQSLYRWAWEYINRRGDFWKATPAEIAAHWRARYAELLASSCGLSLGSSGWAKALPSPNQAADLPSPAL